MLGDQTVCVYKHNACKSYSPVAMPPALSHFLMWDQQGDLLH